MTGYDFLARYFIPVLVLATGCIFAFISFLFATARAEGDGNEKTQRIGKWSFPIVRVPKGWKTWVGILGWVFVAGSIVSSAFIVFQMTQKEITSISGVSLVSMKYASGGWNPHQVDLRTATSSGIPAGATMPLKFSEISVFAPPELAGFQVWAEFLANGNEKIGETPVTVLQSGITNLENIKIVEAYRYLDKTSGTYSGDSWDVLKSWNTIDINLKYKGSSGQEGLTIWKIKLNQMSGTAWWNSPPDVNIVSVVYSVSDGIQQVLDLRREPKPVINAKAGDWITIHAVWYKANSNNINNQSMFIGGSINDGQRELENKSSDMAVIREGIHQFENFTSMTWVLSSDIKHLGLIAIRSDDTVLDGYTIEISDTETSGLVSSQKSVVWPFNESAYMDFETPTDFDGWVSSDPNTFAQTTAQSFSGGHSMAVTVKSDLTQVFTSHDRSFKAEVLLGQIYWPKQDGFDVQWAQVCIGSGMACVSVSTEPGRWNTFVMDFSEISYEEKYLNEVEMPSFFVQGKVIGASSDKPYTFYVDGIQIYPVITP
jgi:hypothetical protein